MKFRPCIDLHQGKVKQIVGSSFCDNGKNICENFVAIASAGDFARMYSDDRLKGGHLIRLGTGNDEASVEALKAYPKGLQIGGGITSENAEHWLSCGAEKLILTSFVFESGKLREDRLQELAGKVTPQKITLDLSCSNIFGKYHVMSNRWQTDAKIEVTPDIFSRLARYCSEFLIHSVDSEGKNQGPDKTLLNLLAQAPEQKIVYAGGIRNFEDLKMIEKIGNGKIDFTVGSALDIFGGKSLCYKDLISKYA